MAVALACLTGCYTTNGISRIPRDVPLRVESRPNGTHLVLAAVEAEQGRVVIAAEERDMCREHERGLRSSDIETRQTKKRDGMGGSGGHPAILILAPLLILAAIIYFASPDEMVTVEPSGELPEPYASWRGARAPCGGPPRPAPGVPLALVLRQSSTDCSGWTAITGPDGTLALADALDPAAAVSAQCDRLSEDGLLLVEEAPREGTKGLGRRSGEERTSDHLTLPLPLKSDGE